MCLKFSQAEWNVKTTQSFIAGAECADENILLTKNHINLLEA